MLERSPYASGKLRGPVRLAGARSVHKNAACSPIDADYGFFLRWIVRIGSAAAQPHTCFRGVSGVQGHTQHVRAAGELLCSDAFVGLDDCLIR